VIGGSLYLVGTILCGVNLFQTWRHRPAVYDEPLMQAAPLQVRAEPGAWPTSVPAFVAAAWHRVWERRPLLFTGLTIAAVLAASLLEIVPTFLIRSNVPTIASVKPYTPLELAGRDLYLAEGCYNCHSQMVRPIRAETERYGESSKPGEFVYDHPFQWGSRRIGPDLHRVGGKYPYLWHVRHMQDPTSTTPRSIMPPFPWMLTDDLDWASIQRKVDVMAMLGVPYGEAVNKAEAMAHTQAATIAREIEAQGGPKGLEHKQIIALVAYLQRLGTDIKGTPAATVTQAATPRKEVP
jgi:cytochrome c oxidase cbb3-type subunit I/II